MILLFFAHILLFVPDREVMVTNYFLKGKTATGEFTTEIQEPFVAVSRDLLRDYPLESSILLYHCEWEGVYRVKDKMGKRHKNAVDVFAPTKSGGFHKCKCRKID